MMTADDIINDFYIPYLINSCFEEMFSILLHIKNLLQMDLCTYRTNFELLITVLLKKITLLRRSNVTFFKLEIDKRILLIHKILNQLDISNKLTRKQYDLVRFICNHVEPINMRILHPKVGTLGIIKQYEKRCFVVHQLLRTNPRCHPKLRNYVQSFSLDRETFIRHIMLHSFKEEYVEFANILTFKEVFWYEFGWTDEMMAYENVIRITADVSLIVSIYLDTFPKHTFIRLLYAIVMYYSFVINNTTSDKHKAIWDILFRTLSSMNDIISKTCYGKMYNLWLKRIQNINPYMETCFDEICKWLDNIFDYESETISLVNTEECICDNNLYCRYHGSLLKKEIAAKYNAYTFIRECIKSWSYTKSQYYERLMRNVFLEE